MENLINYLEATKWGKIDPSRYWMPLTNDSYLEVMVDAENNWAMLKGFNRLKELKVATEPRSPQLVLEQINLFFSTYPEMVGDLPLKAE